jgi:hypothetical protein
LVLEQNGELEFAHDLQGALDALGRFLCRRPGVEGPVVLTRGVAYGVVVEAMLTREVTDVEFDTADRILTGLGLGDLWHSELEDLYGALPCASADAWCPTCEQWTLGERCGWCDTRTQPVERMLEHKLQGLCELCRRHVAGTLRQHRLCGRHEPLRRKLGQPLEQRLGFEQPTPAARPASFSPKLTKQHLDLLYRVYRDELIGTPTLGQMVWDQLGFRNPQSASNAIMYGFVALGYEIRSRSEGRRMNVPGRRRLGFGGRAHTGRAMSAAGGVRVRLEGAGPQAAFEPGG